MTAPPRDEPPRRRLDLIVQPALGATETTAADRLLLDAVTGGASPGALRVYELNGDVLSLGRYHLAPDPVAGAAATLLRRYSGGRAVPAGTGFIGISLALPHRSALVGDAPLSLAPEQVMNRCVRGILAAGRHAGLSMFYPGRDTITVAGRMLAMVSFEVEPTGALLFEAVLASGRDFGILPGLLDMLDPAGAVPARMLAPGEVTSLGRELDRVPTTTAVAQWLADGYAESFGLDWTPKTFPLSAPAEAERDGWLRQRRSSPELERRGTVATQLGTLEVHFSVRADRLARALIAGDFIASSAAIAALETALAGCPAERQAIDDVVRPVFANPAHFILGIGPLATIAETFARGLDA